MRHIKSYYLLALVLFFSCHKKDNSHPHSPYDGLKIESITGSKHSGNFLYAKAYYGADNKVVYMAKVEGSLDTAYYQYYYADKEYNITRYYHHVATDTTRIILNNDGTINRVIRKYDSSFFSYNNLGQPIQMINCDPNSTYTEFLTWANWDIIADSALGNHNVCSYNTEAFGQPADGMRINAFLNYGQSVASSLHLPVNISIRGGTSNQDLIFSYEFDAAGRIAKMIKVDQLVGFSSGDTSVYTITYYP